MGSLQIPKCSMHPWLAGLGEEDVAACKLPDPWMDVLYHTGYGPAWWDPGLGEKKGGFQRGWKRQLRWGFDCHLKWKSAGS